MTYTLEMNSINPNNECLFFHMTGIATPAQYQEYITPIIAKHIALGTWEDPEAWNKRLAHTVQRQVNDTRAVWQNTVLVQKFKTIEGVESFFKDLIADGTEYRRLRRSWHQKTGILVETNILDESNSIVKSIHNCHANICLRYGCCETHIEKCDIVKDPILKNKFPVFHLENIDFKNSWNRVS